MSDPELVLVLADLDAEKLLSALLHRGVERGCLRRGLPWTVVRDPMRDARLAQQPLAALGPHARSTVARFLVVWDHHGSGRENEGPTEVEADVVAAFERNGVSRDRVMAVAFAPELEVSLEPVWDRVLDEVAGRRQQTPKPMAFDGSDPKEALAKVARAHRVRVDSTLFEDLGGKLSLERLKQGAALGRIAAQLVDWFGR